MKSVSIKGIFDYEKNHIRIQEDTVNPMGVKSCGQIKSLRYVVAFVNIGYFTCFIPFRYKYSSLQNCYVMVEYGPQKVGATLFHFIYICNAIFFYIDRIITYQLSPDQNPLQFLNFAENTINLVYAFAWTYALNFKLRDFRMLLDLCQKHHRAMTAGSVGCQQSVWKSTLGWQFRVWLYFMIYGFIEEYYSEISANLSGAKVGLTFLPKSVRTCWFVFICYGRAVGECASVLLFSFGWLLKILCEDLKKEILENRTSYANIMERYLDIKAINERINSISETVVLSFCIGSIPFVSDAMMSLSITKPLFSLTFLFSVNNTIISMIGSAGANNKAAELKHALILRTNNKNLPVDENKDDMLRVSILISEFSTPSIGLRGMSFFTVTYGILGMMLSQCVVYALIILQLKLGDATSSMKN